MIFQSDPVLQLAYRQLKLRFWWYVTVLHLRPLQTSLQVGLQDFGLGFAVVNPGFLFRIIFLFMLVELCMGHEFTKSHFLFL